MRPEEREIKTYLITAPFGADLGQLPRVLDRAEIQWEWAKSELAYSERRPKDLRRLMRQADFVIGVILGTPGDANTMYEIGIAVGLNKPVFIVLSDEATPSLNLSAFPHVRASLTDENALALHLDLLTQSVRQGHRSRTPSWQTWRSAKPPTEASLSHRRETGRADPDSTQEGYIANLIESAGGQVVLQPHLDAPAGKFIPDILFWLPSRDAELLNPAVIEIQAGPLSEQKLEHTQRQLIDFMQEAGIRTGLIIGRGLTRKAPEGFRGSPALNIFFLDLDEFQNLLHSSQLGDWLRKERNRAVHGLR